VKRTGFVSSLFQVPRFAARDNVVQQIHVYSEAARASLEEFLQRHPYPFLVHSGGSLKDVDRSKTRGLTVDRIIVENPSQRPPKVSDNFFAGELRSREGDNVITVGFSSTCDVVISDQSLSKQHAWFELTSNGNWRVWDNDSLAGTQVNEKPIKPGEPKILATGDKITFGYVDVTFLTADAFHRLLRGLL
jgi:pSer/pThr/pTyr-binding forkhead associated (FHA) protein